MRLLTFDIEDWYCHDNLSRDMEWDKFEVRIYEGVERILDELHLRKQKATFFCLGWIAEHHPKVIRMIDDEGHQIGCHSYQHELITRFNKDEFREDLHKAIAQIENVTGKKVELFRAPAFSITENNLYALDVLAEEGISTDCSIFPSNRDFGGMPSFGMAVPAIISHEGVTIKEFPINLHRIVGRDVVFSGGGYFRLMPYWLIRQATEKSPYVMTYFHPSDFDPWQPQMKHLPRLRQWKNRVGLSGAFDKFKRYLNDFDFINVEEASKLTDWSKAKIVNL